MKGEGCFPKDRDFFVWSAPRQGPTLQSGSGRKLEIPRLALLARDDRHSKMSGWQGEGRDKVGRRDSGVTTRAQSCVVPKTSYDANRMATPSSWRSVHRGRSMACESTLACPLPPVGSRGRGPWSGRGSQRVKPRLVSPFERRRLFFKGQGFLRVVCARARPYPLRPQRFRVGDPSTRSTRSG